MYKFWKIFGREYAQVVKKKSFLVGVILTPLIMAFFIILPGLLVKTKATSTEKMAIIDQSGMRMGEEFKEAITQYKLKEMKEGTAVDDVTETEISRAESDGPDNDYYTVERIFEIAFEDTSQYNHIYDSLRNLIIEKDLKYFLVIRPSPYLSDTNVFLVSNSENIVTYRRFELALSQLLASVRLNMSNVNLDVDSVLNLTRQLDLKTKDALGDAIPFSTKYFSAFSFVMIMYIMIFGYGQLVMRSVIEEKNSRIMEVMVSSVSPFQLMLGKIVGLGAATLTQVGIWVLMGVGLYLMKGSFNVNPSIDRIIFNLPIVVFFTLFLILGYLLYSTLFALIGSIVNEEKEAQNYMFPIVMCMALPFVIGIYVIQEPNSTLPVVLSMIPFFTPTMMTMRVVFVAPTQETYSLFSGIVGEALLGVVIIAVATVGMIWLTSRIFRIGILMYGKRPTLPEIIKWIKY